MRRALLRGGMVTLVVVLGLASCGGDDDDDSDDDSEQEESGGSDDTEVDAPAEDYVAAVADALSDPESGLGIDSAGATCMGDTLVAVAGVDALHEAGVTPDELAESDDLVTLGLETTETMVADLAGGFVGCDVATEIEAAFLGPELTTQSSCVADALDDQAFVDAMAQSFVDVAEGATKIGEVVEPALAACPAELTDLVFQAFATDPATEPTPEVRACVEGYVTDHAGEAAAVVTIGDQTSITALVDEITAACPGF